MLWTLESAEPVQEPPAEGWAGRWALHRHRDELGEHLDLRLEQDGVLGGLRVEGSELAPGVCAVEKGPHPLKWLAASASVEKLGAGRWGWLWREPALREIVLEERKALTRLAWRRAETIPLRAAARLGAWCREHQVDPDQLEALCADGWLARQAARERCRGLAALLEGEVQDPAAWQKQFGTLSLAELNARLELLEARLDRKHFPPALAAPPDGASLPPEADAARALSRTMNLLRDLPPAG
ncbi:MAG TPA: hypothetical protein PLX03_09560 [Candidatus Hydrogenedentes bacterium]|nr:hypothetical protein [Candidatus Hydrogenedentota bacterium]